jgi:ankyrin repeat protein
MISYREFHEKINQGNQKRLQKDDLFYLIVNRKIEELEFFLTKVDPKPNLEVNKGGYTPLMLAAQDGNLKILKCLLDAKANVNASNGFGETALMYLAGYVSSFRDKDSSNRIPCIKTLLEFKADPNKKDNQGQTVLHQVRYYEFKKNYPEVLGILLDANANPNIQDRYGGTVLIEAAQCNSIEGIKILLSHGAQVHYQRFERTALDYATNATCKALIKAATPETSICGGFLNRLFKPTLPTTSQPHSDVKVHSLT